MRILCRDIRRAFWRYRPALIIVWLCAGSLFAAPGAQTEKSPDPQKFPARGKLIALYNGDAACFVDIRVRKKTLTLPADFAACEKSVSWIGRAVRLRYTLHPIQDCPSAEPCGKNKTVWLIADIALENP